MTHTYIIAEAGVNHNGKLELAKKLVDVAKEAGVDAVKFQTFKAEKIVTPEAEQAKYQTENIGKKESQYAMLKRLELPYSAFQELKEYCDEKEIIFLSTPHSCQEDVDLVAELSPAIKVGSGDLTNLPILKYIARKNLPIILATGMACLEEVKEAVETILPINRELILLHCTTNYPTPLNEVNLKAMLTLKKEFNLPIGYSDHTEDINVSLAAVALGACIIEKHFTLDRNLQGPDHKASLEPKDLKEMVEGIRNTETKLTEKENPQNIIKELDIGEALGNGIKEPRPSEVETAKVARKSIVAVKDIKKGAAIKEKMLAIKRPGTGIEPKYLNKVIGRITKENIKKDSIIKWDDFENTPKKHHRLGYKETLNDLSTRINVHKKFSQFEINDWILDSVKLKPGERVLDVGCGNGKQVIAYSKVVGRKGMVVGADMNEELLKRAKERSEEENSKVSFEVQDFDKKFKWENSSFDLVSCCFAIYYAQNTQKTLSEMKRVLKNNGRLFICGPTENNSIELNQIHEKVTHRKVPETAILRAGRIKHEILPIVKKRFGKVKVEIFHNRVSFPTAKSFIDYYSSTLLFKESVPNNEKEKVLEDMYYQVRKNINDKKTFDLTKEVIGIIAYE